MRAGLEAPGGSPLLGIGPGHGQWVCRTLFSDRSCRPGATSPGSSVLLGSPPHRGLECPYLLSHQKMSRKERITIPSIVPSSSSPGGFPPAASEHLSDPCKIGPRAFGGSRLPSHRPSLGTTPTGLISGIQALRSSAVAAGLSENSSGQGGTPAPLAVRTGRNERRRWTTQGRMRAGWVTAAAPATTDRGLVRCLQSTGLECLQDEQRSVVVRRHSGLSLQFLGDPTEEVGG